MYVGVCAHTCVVTREAGSGAQAPLTPLSSTVPAGCVLCQGEQAPGPGAHPALAQPAQASSSSGFGGVRGKHAGSGGHAQGPSVLGLGSPTLMPVRPHLRGCCGFSPQLSSKSSEDSKQSADLPCDL